jgi:hypothetical protein
MPCNLADTGLLHLQAAPNTGHRHLRDEVSGASPPAGAAAAQDSAAGAAPGRVGSAGAAPREEISSSGREGACKRLAAALGGSAPFAASGGEATAAAAELERGIHDAVATRCGCRESPPMLQEIMQQMRLPAGHEG